MYVCVCVCVRERERESVCVCVCLSCVTLRGKIPGTESHPEDGGLVVQVELVLGLAVWTHEETIQSQPNLSFQFGEFQPALRARLTPLPVLIA